MEEVIVDKKQIIGEAKERNEFYKALLEIRELLTMSAHSSSAILEVCNNTLDGKI